MTSNLNLPAPMSDAQAGSPASIEVISPDNSRHLMHVKEFPFFVGRGEAGNHLTLPDMRISRQCAAIVAIDGRYYLEDRGHRLGVFINNKKITRQPLEDQDVITFGLNDSYQLVFRQSETDTKTTQNLLSSMDGPGTESVSLGLGKLDLLLKRPGCCIPSFPWKRCWTPCWIRPSPLRMQTAVCCSRRDPRDRCSHGWHAVAGP